jgi:heme A synthase
MTRAATATAADAPPASRTRNPLYSAVIGLAALAVLLQGLWAGLFVQEGKDYKQSWVHVHATGADVAILLAIVATVVAVVKLRDRRDLIVGSGALVVLLVLEAYLGGLIGKHSNLTAIHFPLAMALMALSVWLPLRATRG